MTPPSKTLDIVALGEAMVEFNQRTLSDAHDAHCMHKVLVATPATPPLPRPEPVRGWAT